MNIFMLFSLLLLLAPGGCHTYSIGLGTLEKPNDFQNELMLQSLLNSEFRESRSNLNSNTKINDVQMSAEEHFQQARNDPFEDGELDPSIEGRIQGTYYAAASPEEPETELEEIDKVQVYRSANEETDFLGTNLFFNYPKKCFSTEDIALMSARKDFELLVPKTYPQSLLSDDKVYTLMKYFNSVNQVVKRKSDVDTRRLLQRALYDSLGGYLRYYLLPVAQLSYYAGRIKLCTMERLSELYHQCQLVLNTNGNGWKSPPVDVLSQLKGVQIKPIKVDDTCSTESDASSCALLDQSCLNDEAQNELMIVPLPHLETEDANGYLSNIFLPFKHRRIYNLRSPESSFILVKFFKTLTSCYRFQAINQRTYNQKLRNWIRENLQLHYRDEIFYPGLGGVLQVYEALGCMPKSPEEAQTAELDDNSNGNQLELDGNKKDKKSRSLIDQEMIKVHKKETGDECVDCDDESLMAYVAAVIALLVLVLLLFACCCIRRSNRKKNDMKSNQQQPNRRMSDVEIAPRTLNSTEEPEQSCWSSLFRSRRKKKPDSNAKKSQPDTSKEVRKPKATPGMSIVGTTRDELFPSPVALNDLAKLLPRKKHDRKYEESLTSTSSLGYQFHRKFLPVKMGPEKRDEYYSRSERKRSRPASKNSSSGQEKQREREKPKPIIEEHLTGESEEEEKLLEREECIRQKISSRIKYGRQEGGVTPIQKREGKFTESDRTTENHASKKQTSQERNIGVTPTQKREVKSTESDRTTENHASKKQTSQDRNIVVTPPQKREVKSTESDRTTECQASKKQTSQDRNTGVTPPQKREVKSTESDRATECQASKKQTSQDRNKKSSATNISCTVEPEIQAAKEEPISMPCPTPPSAVSEYSNHSESWETTYDD